MCTSVTTLLLIPLLMVLIDLGRASIIHTPPDVRVLSPSEFQVILSPEKHGPLKKIRVSINESNGKEFERVKPVGRVIPFSDKNLSLKKGDAIYYSLVFDEGNGPNGTYIFDGVFKDTRRRRREVYFYEPEEETAGPQHSRYLRREYGSPLYDHYHGQYHNYHRHYDHFGSPPFGYHSHPGPGPWRGPGHDHRDRFGNRRPWDHHDGSCDGNKPKPTGGNQGHGQNQPWHGNNNNGNDGFDKTYGGNGPNISGPGINRPHLGNGENSSSSTKKYGTHDGKSTKNPNAEIFTTKRTNSTQSTTMVPDIDIRLRVPEDR